jgi:hypothetical protein
MTPVDDVRVVRERLNREAGGDIRVLAERARLAFEQYREQLGLKLVKPPERTDRPTGTSD